MNAVEKSNLLNMILEADHGRFKVTAVACTQSSCTFVLHDAAQVSDDQMRAGVRPPVIAEGNLDVIECALGRLGFWLTAAEFNTMVMVWNEVYSSATAGAA